MTDDWRLLEGDDEDFRQYLSNKLADIAGRSEEYLPMHVDEENLLTEDEIPEYVERLSKYQDRLKNRLPTRKPGTVFAAVVYEDDENISQDEVREKFGVGQSQQLRNHREHMGFRLDRESQKVKEGGAQIYSWLDEYAEDVADDRSAKGSGRELAAAVDVEVLGKDVSEAAEYYEVDEDEVIEAVKWMDETEEDVVDDTLGTPLRSAVREIEDVLDVLE
jgi:hypothetical protein